MSVPVTFVLHAIDIGGTQIGQITNATYSATVEEMLGRNAGEPEPQTRSVMSERHTVTFDTTALATLFGIVGVNGYCPGSAVDLYFRATVDCGTRQALAQTQHARYRAAKTFVFINSIRADQGGEAVANVTVECLYDGSAEPVVYAGSQALANELDGNEYFTLGPVSVNSINLAGVRSLSIDTNLTFRSQSAAGEIHRTRGYVEVVEPQVMAEGFDITAIGALAPGGTALSALVAYLRRKEPQGANYATGSSQHIKFTASNGLVFREEISGSGDSSEGMGRVRIAPVKLSDTAPITIATAQTIT